MKTPLRSVWALAFSCATVLFSSASAQTIIYTNAGVYTNVAPAGAALIQVKLWGAGGGNGATALAGGGAFASSSFAVSPGDTFVTVVGQRGAASATNLAGAGSGNTQGGAPGYLGDYNGRGQGGQASSLLNLTNGYFVLKTLAGAGGGGGGFGGNGAGGAGGKAGSADSGAIAGQPGANGIGGNGGGSAGSNYAADATTIGITNLNQAGGNGGNATNWSGGGGGGYGGGGGGGGGANGNGAGGGGGGSYGDIVIPGSGTQPGNNTDAAYEAGRATAGNDGLAVITFAPGNITSVTNIQFTQATVVAILNPGGQDTACSIEYGTTTNYGTSSPTQMVPANAGTVSISQTLSNLLASTLYHCRLVMSNASGTVLGLDVTFSTVTVTNSYAAAGVYTNVAPGGTKKVLFKLWGAGGGSGNGGQGGGGAFSSVALDASPGDTFVFVVGQRGAYATNDLGGAGSGNTAGGSPGLVTSLANGCGQGGQASSVFQITNDLFVTKAVAGGGGGSGLNGSGGAGGLPGAYLQPNAQGGLPGTNGLGGSGGPGAAPGGAGSDYATGATTTGIASLSLASGNGGVGNTQAGGGGGGYGGGGGGSAVFGSSAGGGGGGSYGTTIILGNGTTPGNTNDPSYTSNAGVGGILAVNNNTGYDGLVVLIWNPAVIGTAPTLTNPTVLSNGGFQFAFTNLAGASFTAQATTNLAQPGSWSPVGAATEVSPGQYQFNDLQATNYPQRFYRISSP